MRKGVRERRGAKQTWIRGGGRIRSSIQSNLCSVSRMYICFKSQISLRSGLLFYGILKPSRKETLSLCPQLRRLGYPFRLLEMRPIIPDFYSFARCFHYNTVFSKNSLKLSIDSIHWGLDRQIFSPNSSKFKSMMGVLKPISTSSLGYFDFCEERQLLS